MAQSSQSQQTAVEWLMEKLYKKGYLKEIDYEPIIIMNEAKEMEKKQRQEMYLKGIENYDTTFKRK